MNLYKPKYSFKQYETCLIAFMGNIDLKLQEVFESIPVLVLQTGDQSYFLDKKFNKTENQEIYQSIPRFVCSFGDIQPNNEEKSNKENPFIFKFEEKEYRCIARRMPFIIPVETNLVCSNFIRMLEGLEIMTMFAARNNVFTYEYAGSTFECAYSVSSNSNENPGMDIGSNSRNSIVKTNFDLQIHLMVPRIETIKLLSEFESIGTRYDIRDNAGELPHNDTMTILKSEE